jgi:HEAT repeat protein
MAGDQNRILLDWLSDPNCDRRADDVHGICTGLVRGISLDSEIDDLLIFALRQSDDCWLARLRAAQCLGNRNSIQALNPLIRAINDIDPRVAVRGAIWAIGQIAARWTDGHIAIQLQDAVFDNLLRALEEIRLVNDNFQNENDSDIIREAIQNIEGALGR